MDSARFKKLLKKYERNELQGKELDMMDRWFQLRTKPPGTWSEEEQQKLIQKVMLKVRSGNAYRHTVKALWMNPWIKVAAAIVLLVTASVLLWLPRAPDMLKAITLSHAEKIMLPDGSIVWLKEFSTLSYPEKFAGDTRNVSFTGEALFEIAKDPAHPFTIKYGEFSATVLGTSFTLSTRSVTHIELTVLTGKVRLASVSDAHGVTVTPNVAVVYNGKKVIAETNITEIEKIALVKDTEYSMLFNDTSVKDIIKKIEQKFGVNVILENESINECVLTGDFTDYSLHETLEAMKQPLGFAYGIVDDGKEIVIKGKGCN